MADILKEGPVRKILRERGLTKESPQVRPEELFPKLAEVMDRYGEMLAGQSEMNCVFIADQLGARFNLPFEQIETLRKICIKKASPRGR